ncbi:hypothetical protein RN001_001529 [Aquatica leii]|uniref:Uncharacterized protein n=1 Tax=Aquatica leii TaxID=1421715 RepID=A0AAN7QMX7_9COLE|nr:hypothetical protein RN001_001529 [Aquatica leii]
MGRQKNIRYPFQLISIDLIGPLPKSTNVTGFTPSFLNFGRTVPCYGDYYGQLSKLTNEPISLDTREQLVNDVNQLSPLYKDVGDFVWKRNPVLSDASKGFAKKLAPKYVKAKVIEITGSVTYRLVDLTGRNLGVWHIKDLKPCYVNNEDDFPIDN